jgi:hypothetical protein
LHPAFKLDAAPLLQRLLSCFRWKKKENRQLVSERGKIWRAKFRAHELAASKHTLKDLYRKRSGAKLMALVHSNSRIAVNVR